MRNALYYLFVLNWKTTFLGIGALLGAVGHLLTGLANGDASAIAHEVPIILVGLGLVAARDVRMHP